MYTGWCEPRAVAVYETSTTELRLRARAPKPRRHRRGLRWWQNALISTLALLLILVGSAFGVAKY
jgi:hypothetical protein